MCCHAGYEVPVLAGIAQKVTAVACSAGSRQAQSSQNRLSPGRSRELLYVHRNTHLIESMRAPKKAAQLTGEAASGDDKCDDIIDYESEEDNS